jgi:hypothetical protein
LISVYIIFTQRYTWLAFAPGVIILLLLQSGLLNILVSAVDDGLGEPLATVIGAPLLLALGAWGLHLIFPRGGDRHLAWFKRYNMRAHALRDGQQRVPSSVVGVWRQALWRSGYLASLRRHSRSGGTPRRMMMYALGPGAHPGGYIGYAVLCTLATVVLLAALGAATSSTSRLVLATLMQWAVLFACLMYAAGVADGVRRYQTELGMFFLSARSPAAAQVNHQFGGALLSAYLGVWLAAAAGVALIDFFLLGQLKLRGATFLYMMMALAWSCLLLRNYAAMRHVARPLQVMATTLVGMLVCGLVLALSLVERGIPWFWLGGVVAAGTALALRRRWQKLMTAPPVLRLDRLA